MTRVVSRMDDTACVAPGRGCERGRTRVRLLCYVCVMTLARAAALFCLCVPLASGCSEASPGSDAGRDAGRDAGQDAGPAPGVPCSEPAPGPCFGAGGPSNPCLTERAECVDDYWRCTSAEQHFENTGTFCETQPAPSDGGL